LHPVDIFLAYLPLVISIIIIIGVALFVASRIESQLLKKFTEVKIVAFIVKAAIIALAVFMTLNQLVIATSIVNAAFIIVLDAVAAAFLYITDIAYATESLYNKRELQTRN
jgi:predicted MFS family arabinose efflux permease